MINGKALTERFDIVVRSGATRRRLFACAAFDARNEDLIVNHQGDDMVQIDIVDKNLMQLAEKKHRLRLQFSDQGMQELRTMHARVMDTLQLSFNVFMVKDVASARRLIDRKTELRTLELEGMENHVGRLTSGQRDSIVTSAIHLDVLRDFKRINSHLASVGYPVLERAGELRKTRLKKAKVKPRSLPEGSPNPPSEPSAGLAE